MDIPELNIAVVKQLKEEIRKKDVEIGKLEEEIESLTVFQRREFELTKEGQEQEEKKLLEEEKKLKEENKILENKVKELEERTVSYDELEKKVEFVILFTS